VRRGLWGGRRCFTATQGVRQRLLSRWTNRRRVQTCMTRGWLQGRIQTHPWRRGCLRRLLSRRTRRPSRESTSMGDGRLLAARCHRRPHRTCEGPTRCCTATSRCVRHDVSSAAVSRWSSAFAADLSPSLRVGVRANRTHVRRPLPGADVAPCTAADGAGGSGLPPPWPMIDRADAKEEQGKSMGRGIPPPDSLLALAACTGLIAADRECWTPP
jgi:hypothetical protein